MQCMYAMPWYIFLYESYVIDLLEDSSPVFDFMYPGTHTVIHFTRPWHRAWGEFNNADGADPEAELACELLADYAHGASQAIIYHSCIFQCLWGSWSYMFCELNPWSPSNFKKYLFWKSCWNCRASSIFYLGRKCTSNNKDCRDDL